MDLATLLDGPANLRHRNQLLKFKGGLTLTPASELFDISTDLEGIIDRRALENTIVLTGTPSGVFTTDLLGMTHRWQNPKIGQLVTPRYDVESVDAGDDTLTLVGAAVLRLGCPFMFSVFPGGTAPAGLVNGTVYFYGEGGTVHTTEADAIAGDDPVAITDVGTGDFAIIEQEYIQVDAINANRRITFWNGGVTAMPPLIHSAVETIMGQIAFGCFIKNNAAWNAANSLYSVTKVALSDVATDKTQIPTQEYGLAFGATPFDAFKSRGPVTVTPALSTAPVSTDARGNVGFKISGLAVSATFSPQGFSHQQMLDVLALQGGAVARGKSRVRGDLVITGTGVHTTVYNATPRELPQTFQATGQLAGELAADGSNKPGSGYFRVATTAPA